MNGTNTMRSRVSWLGAVKSCENFISDRRPKEVRRANDG